MALASIYKLTPLKMFSKMCMKSSSYVFQQNKYMKPLLSSSSIRISLMLSKMTVAEELGFPEPPKRPATPLIRYIVEEGKKMTHVKPSEKVSKLSREWGNLDESVKEKYISEYTKELEIYKENYLQYLKHLTPDQINEMKILKEKRKTERKILREKRKLRKQKEELGKPKHPGTPLTLFLESLRENKETTGSNLMMSAIEKWQKLPENEKDVYKEKYSKIMEQYLKELTVWENKMKSIGRPDLVRKGSLDLDSIKDLKSMS